MRTLRILLVLILAASLFPGWNAAAAPSCPQQSAAASESAAGQCEGCSSEDGTQGCVAVTCPAPCAIYQAVTLTGTRVSFESVNELAPAPQPASRPTPRSIPPALPPPR